MARAPRGKKQAGERAAKIGRRGPSALVVVIFLLLAGAAGLAAWLSYSFEPPSGPLGNSEPVLSIDLSKDGGGKQAAPKMAAKAAATRPDGTKSGAKTDLESGAKQAKPETKAAAAAKGAAPKIIEDKPAHDTAAKPEPARQQASIAPTPSPEPSPTPSPAPAPRVEVDEPATPAQPAPSEETKSSAKAVPMIGSFTARGGLYPAPDPALIKSTDNGPLPVVAPDGRTPLQVYARPYKATGRPRIAVVIGSLGLSQATTLAAIQQLPGGVTLAFAPYGRNLQDYVNQARAAGHEVLLQVPMEPMDYPTNDPGPHTLLTSLTINRNLQRLDWLLGRFAGYVGVVNFMGGRFTAAESHVLPVLAAMRDRGLMFLDARASSASVAASVAARIGLSIAANDRVVDAIASRAAIDARLLELERLASAGGGAIGIGFPYPVTIERLAQWTRAMGDRGYDLVPVSALATQRQVKQ